MHTCFPAEEMLVNDRRRKPVATEVIQPHADRLVIRTGTSSTSLWRVKTGSDSRTYNIMSGTDMSKKKKEPDARPLHCSRSLDCSPSALMFNAKGNAGRYSP